MHLKRYVLLFIKLIKLIYVTVLYTSQLLIGYVFYLILNFNYNNYNHCTNSINY